VKSKETGEWTYTRMKVSVRKFLIPMRKVRFEYSYYPSEPFSQILQFYLFEKVLFPTGSL